MAKYMTPDFDVTVYEIKDTITADGMDGGQYSPSEQTDWEGDINFD